MSLIISTTFLRISGSCVSSPPASGIIFQPFLAPKDGRIAKLTSPLIINLFIGIPSTDSTPPPLRSGLPALEPFRGVAHLDLLEGVPQRDPLPFGVPHLDPARELSLDKLALNPFALV